MRVVRVIIGGQATKETTAYHLTPPSITDHRRLLVPGENILPSCHIHLPKHKMKTQNFPQLDKLNALQVALTDTNLAQFTGLRLAERAWAQANKFADKTTGCTVNLLQDVYSDTDVLYTVQVKLDGLVFNASDGIWQDSDGETADTLDGLVNAGYLKLMLA